MADLAIAQFLGRFGPHQIIDSGGPAAQCRFGGFQDLQFGDFSQYSAGLRLHALRML